MKTKKRGAQKAPKKKDGRRALAVGTGSGYTSNDSYFYELTYGGAQPKASRKAKARPMFRQSAIDDMNRFAAALSRCDSCPNID